MFVCDFILNGECQLLSKKCHDKCKMKNQCHSCRYKFHGKGSTPCKECENAKMA